MSDKVPYSYFEANLWKPWLPVGRRSQFLCKPSKSADYGSKPRSRRRVFRGGSELPPDKRSEEHTSELQSLMRISYAVFCLKKKKKKKKLNNSKKYDKRYIQNKTE